MRKVTGEYVKVPTKAIIRYPHYKVHGSEFCRGPFYALFVIDFRMDAAIITDTSVEWALVTFQVLPGTAIDLGLSVVIARCVVDLEQTKYCTQMIFKIIYAGFIISSAVTLSLILKIHVLSPEATRLT